jgi:hypothetical protein
MTKPNIEIKIAVETFHSTKLYSWRIETNTGKEFGSGFDFDNRTQAVNHARECMAFLGITEYSIRKGQEYA